MRTASHNLLVQGILPALLAASTAVGSPGCLPVPRTGDTPVAQSHQETPAADAPLAPLTPDAGPAEPAALEVDDDPDPACSKPETGDDRPPPPHPQPVSLRITAIGDVNFNRNRVAVRPDGIDVWGDIVAFATLTQGLEGWIDGDVNFANIETVVTARNDFQTVDPGKAFCFRSHPNGVAQLIHTGFNLFCLANNHAYDYGDTGIRETLANLAHFAATSNIAYTGIGEDFDQAASPAVLEVNGVRIGMVAIGIGGPTAARAAHDKPGVAHVSRYRDALEKLRDADVDIRILSNHDGKEGILYPIDRQLMVDRVAIRDYDVDVVLGHHPHRVQGVERYLDGLIFYSLGNGIMRGAADIGGRKVGELHADFGLLARMDISWDPSSRTITFRRIEAVPLHGMHSSPGVFEPDEAAARIRTLNRISEPAYLEQDISPGCPERSRNERIVFQHTGVMGVVEFP